MRQGTPAITLLTLLRLAQQILVTITGSMSPVIPMRTPALALQRILEKTGGRLMVFMAILA